MRQWLAVLVMILFVGCTDDTTEKTSPDQGIDGVADDAVAADGLAADQQPGDQGSVDAPPDKNAWAISAGSKADMEGAYGVAVDSAGNMVVTGAFQEKVSFGAIQLTSKGERDAFVVKLDSGGKVLWAVSAGGSSPDGGDRVALDGAGNAYVAGRYMGTVSFGATTLTAKGGEDVFVAKLSSAGKVLWAVSLGGSSAETVDGLAVDSAGSVRVTGLFGAGQKDGATVTIGSTSLGGGGWGDVYVARLDSAGKFLWAVKGGGTAWDFVDGLGLDSAGNCYIAGSLDEGTAQYGKTVFTSSDKEGGDLFVAKLDKDGNYLWAVTPTEDPTTGASVHATGLAVDSAGNSHVVGWFIDTVSFGATKLTAKVDRDLYVAKLDSGGKFLWAASATPAKGTVSGMGTVVTPRAITLDSAGNSHITGSFGDLGKPGSITFGTKTVTAKGGFDIYVASLDSAGTFVTARAAGSTGEEFGYGIGVDGAGKRYVVGGVGHLSTAPATTPRDSTTLTSQGSADAFIWKVK